MKKGDFIMNKKFHNFLVGVSVLPALLVMPAMATYTWVHPEGVDSYDSIDGASLTSSASANVFTGTAMRNIVNGDVMLTLDGATQTGTAEINGVYGNMFLKSSDITTLGLSALSDEQKLLRQYVDGDVTVVVKNNSSVARNVIGNQFYTNVPAEITGDIGLSGKTTVTIADSSVMKSVRGANIGNSTTHEDPSLAKIKVHDIEINIDNSFVKDEVLSTGAYVSADNVKINVTGNSVIGYTTKDSDTATSALNSGSWIVAGAQRNASSVASTEVNLNTAGTIKVAGDVNAGSRERESDNTEENSVIGNATLSMLGGGNINIGGDVRAYHVGGATELNINNVDVNVAGAVKEFQTINMDENAKLTAGTLIMNANDKLNLTLANTSAYSQIVVDTLDANGATLSMTVRDEGTYNVVRATTTDSNFTWNWTNAVYDLTPGASDGTVVASRKSATKIATENGIEQDAAKAIIGLNASTSEKLNDLGVKIQEKLAEGTPEAIQAAEHIAKAVHPEKEAVTQSVATSIQNTVTSLASARMAAPTIGRSGGDVNFTSGGVWAQGLFNKSKQNDAFSGYTRGIAAGLDGTMNRVWTLGAGYSYAHSDISGSARQTEIDSNTVFLYGQYKPAEWYVNAVANYTMSDYTEEDGAASVTADYDVDSFGINVATGYDFNYGLTPELGLRYMHVMADDYTNSLGIKTKSDNTDFLTGVLGAKYAFNVVADRYTTFVPQLNAAIKYDMLSDKNVATVTMPGVDSYTLRGERLNRLGGEFGIGLGMKHRGMDFSINYDIDVRKDYTSQTGMLKFRYNF